MQVADNELAAELAEIASRARQVLARRGLVGGLLAINAARGDVPRLAQALEAALKLIGEWEASASELDRDIARGRKSHHASDYAQSLTDEEIARSLRDCATGVREAITSELTGKAADSG